ncbi:MAG: hypothetical protein AAF394_13045, partial [Planctomycetota bacterium]
PVTAYGPALLPVEKFSDPYYSENPGTDTQLVIGYTGVFAKGLGGTLSSMGKGTKLGGGLYEVTLALLEFAESIGEYDIQLAAEHMHGALSKTRVSAEVTECRWDLDDYAFIKVRVDNGFKQKLKGRLKLDIFDPKMKLLASEDVRFDLDSGESSIEDVDARIQKQEGLKFALRLKEPSEVRVPFFAPLPFTL